MVDFPILSLITFLPLIGGLFVMFLRGSEATVAKSAKSLALFTSIAVFALASYMYMKFDPASAGFQMMETRQWFPDLNITYKMGVDGISVFFVLLTALLTPIAILSSWENIKKSVREYMLAFLVLETMMIGTFLALDLMLFYVFFEGVLIPMFFIIGIWGGENRVYASFKFFLYTLLGSVLMLVALLALYKQFNTSDMLVLMDAKVPLDVQKIVFLAFFASFAVKLPMFPFHTWLPDAHVEAPTAGSVILAGVLLKMGGYGFIRLALPMLPDAVEYFAMMIFVLSAVAIIYTSLIALVQKDMKKLIAYSSIAHMGFVTIGIFALDIHGVQGAIIQMLSHGVISAALFLCVGVLYDRLHTREIARYGGVVQVMPIFSTLFMLFMFGSMAFPATSGFVGEFLVLLGIYKVNTYITFFAVMGIVLSASYMLYLYKRIIFGEITHKDVQSLKDLSWREILMFLPLAFIVLWMGIYPASFTEPMSPAIEHLLERYDTEVAK